MKPHLDRNPIAAAQDYSTRIRRVTLIDPMEIGHHSDYAALLLRVLQAQGVEVQVIGSQRFLKDVALKAPLHNGVVVSYRHGKGLRAEARKRHFLVQAARIANRNGSQIAHLLFLDRFIMAFAAGHRSFGDVAVATTLHWAYFSRQVPQKTLNLPIRSLERHVLRSLLAQGARMMVHGSSLLETLAPEVGRRGIDLVPYPASPPSEGRMERGAAREKLGLPAEPRLLLAFGATRRDKGVDLAVAALADLPKDVHLVVAGRPSDFDEEDLGELARSRQVAHRLHLRLGFVPDDLVIPYFSACDVVVTPYRKTFSGQSGPLTLAAALGIPVVCSNSPVLAETVETYRLGEVFAAERVPELVSVVRYVLTSPPQPATAKFVNDHSAARFADAVLASYARALGRAVS